ncbi:MAG: Flp family type IVb pilin [Rhodovibrionaceae bacterium]
MLTRARKFLRSERGATAIEYGLIAALVVVGAVVALDSLGDSIAAIFEAATSELAKSTPMAGS